VSGPLRLRPGSVFAGDYKVVRPLTSGGQGSLYVVEQVSTNKQRALKLMLPELVAQPSSRKRFELEAKIAARIQSDHVVETIASGVDPVSGTPWLVMELLEGQDLSTYTQQKKRLPPGEVLEIFSQLCHALGEAHRQGIVHRDLKPENIFLATARRRGVPFMVKVLDFGIARILAESTTLSGSTTTGLGTPMWMAPEQTIPGGPVSPSTDVWPLGLLAFRLLTGYLFWKAPYDPGASVMMLMAEAFMHPLPSASARAEYYKCADRLPPGFDVWFARCVARPMEERFADAAEAFAALDPILTAVREDLPPVSRASGAALDEGGAPKPPSSVKPVTATPVPLAIPTRGTGVAADAAVAAANASTGPGRATWEGAPELSDDALLSASQSDPEGAPVTPPEALSMASRTADQAPPVQTAAPPSGRGRTRAVILAATVAGVLVGAVIFGLQRKGGRGAAAESPAAAVSVRAASPDTSASSPSTSTEEPSSELPRATASAAASSEATSAGAHRKPKLCKQAGAKCFSSDDCCDRSCRKFTCRANTALENPYGSDEK
jgi:serine/threonine protein kinase